MPSVSVIIPTYNEEKLIRKCLLSLRNQSLKPLEIIVVDGSSTDSTVSIVREIADIVLIEKRRRVGYARNLGASRARGELLAFIDADTIVEKNYIEKVTHYFNEKRQVQAAGGYLLPLDNDVDYRLFWVYSNLVKLFSWFNLGWFSGTNVVYRKNFFKKIGGFPPNLVLSEDIILSLTASFKGRIGFHPGIVYTSTRRHRHYGLFRLMIKYLVNLPLTLMKKPFDYYPPIR